MTSYSYDAANRLLTENRTGTNPYASTYTYTNRGQRATAFRSENGVASHNGTYSYDDAGRLTNVADSVSSSGLGGAYTWNADGTLASYPGPGYTRKLDYDEEGRLTKISRDNGSTVTPVFEYGYGFDGGRRWRKDLNGNTWDWYPCGVACCAGELVTMRSTDGGGSWVASSLKLDLQSGNASSSLGFELVEFGNSRLISGSTPTIANTRDSHGVLRFGANLGTNSSTNATEDEGMTNGLVPAVALRGPSLGQVLKCVACIAIKCLGKWNLDCFYSCSKECSFKGRPKDDKPKDDKPKGCPDGTCTFRCPGETKDGCAPPGTKVTCKDGTSMELPKDCAKKEVVPDKVGFQVTF